jgi:hypothetical protein
MRPMRLPCIALASTLAGCGGLPSSRLEATDRSSFVPSARASYALDQDDAPPSRPRNGAAIEIGVTAASASGSQALAAGQPDVVVGGRRLAGPLALRSDFDYRHAEGLVRLRHFFNDNFGIEGLGGIGLASLHVAVSASGQRAEETRELPGVALGLGGLWRALPSTTVQARWTGFFTANWLAFSSKSMENHRLELHLVQALGRHAALRAGWANWSVKSKSEPNSEVQVTFSGPALGLDLMF